MQTSTETLHRSRARDKTAPHTPNAELVFADLTLDALKRHALDECALWAALRDRTPHGVGSLTVNDVRNIAITVHITPKTLQRMLRTGDGLFWNRHEGRVYLRSPARVANVLGVPTFRSAYREARRGHACTPAEMRARLILKSVAAIRGGRPTSVAAIASMTGHSERTVQAWKRDAGVALEQNFQLVAPLSPATSIAALARITRTRGLTAMRYRGRPWLVRRLPDALVALGARGVRSHLRRQNRALRLLRAGRPTCDISGAGTTGRPLYDTGRPGRESNPSAPLYTPVALVQRSGSSRHRRSAVRLWEPTLNA